MRNLALALLTVILLIGPMAAAGATAQETVAAPPTPEQVAAALQTVRADPNLGGERTMKMLRWIDAGERKPANAAWMKWILGFFAWIATSTRYLVWTLVAVLAAWIAVYISRAVRARAAAPAAAPFAAPTHVRNLDIRPESLPRDIGRAARELWERGEHRAALSLLYRGLLSRLAHGHRVPITDSSTEGDCLALIAERAAPDLSAYATRLVEAWQAFVYGGAVTPTAIITELCNEFAGALEPRPPRTGGRPS